MGWLMSWGVANLQSKCFLMQSLAVCSWRRRRRIFGIHLLALFIHKNSVFGPTANYKRSIFLRITWPQTNLRLWNVQRQIVGRFPCAASIASYYFINLFLLQTWSHCTFCNLSLFSSLTFLRSQVFSFSLYFSLHFFRNIFFTIAIPSLESKFTKPSSQSIPIPGLTFQCV